MRKDGIIRETLAFLINGHSPEEIEKITGEPGYHRNRISAAKAEAIRREVAEGKHATFYKQSLKDYREFRARVQRLFPYAQKETRIRRLEKNLEELGQKTNEVPPKYYHQHMAEIRKTVESIGREMKGKDLLESEGMILDENYREHRKELFAEVLLHVRKRVFSWKEIQEMVAVAKEMGLHEDNEEYERSQN